MLYSFITLCRDKLPVSATCLAALARDSVVDGDWELIVVDNGSRDGTGAWLSGALRPMVVRSGGGFALISNKANAGCSTARNQALALARGRYIVFLDNDVMPCTRDWPARLRAALEADPRAGMAGPKMIYPAPPHAIQCAGVGVSRRGHVCFLGRGEPRDAAAYSTPREVQCLISACMMVRAELPREFGGFDELFNPVQFEDFDLCYRYRANGWKAIYTPEAEMFHLESVTTQGTATMQNAAVVVRNGLAFQRRWRGMFENENGPGESECRWKRLPATSLPDLFRR